MILVCIHCLPLYQKHDDIKYNNKKKTPKRAHKRIGKSTTKKPVAQQRDTKKNNKKSESKGLMMGRTGKRVQK